MQQAFEFIAFASTAPIAIGALYLFLWIPAYMPGPISPSAKPNRRMRLTQVLVELKLITTLLLLFFWRITLDY